MFKVHAFCGNLHLADNYTSAIIHSTSTGHLEEQIYFSMQISFQNLTSCRGRKKDRLHDHTKYLFFN